MVQALRRETNEALDLMGLSDGVRRSAVSSSRSAEPNCSCGSTKDFGPSCFHSASTGVGNANAAPEGGVQAFDKA